MQSLWDGGSIPAILTTCTMIIPYQTLELDGADYVCFSRKKRLLFGRRGRRTLIPVVFMY